MIVKITFLFLAFMGLLAIFGKWRVPGQKHLDKLRSRARLGTSKCPRCGAYRIGKSPCACRKGKR